jgi:hypothetical protein
MRPYSTAALIALLLSSTASAAPNAADNAVLTCSAIKPDAERLACYDSAAVKLREALEQEDKDRITFFGLFGTRNKPEPVEAQRATGAGSETTDSASAQAPAQPKFTGLAAKITSVSTDGGGHMVIILDNNQVWRTIESDPVRGAREGVDITIGESDFNGFRLRVVGRSGEYRVQRLL